MADVTATHVELAGDCQDTGNNCQHDSAVMMSSVRPSAKNCLTQELFEAYIAGILKQMPLMAEIDTLASSGFTDTHALEFLNEKLGSGSAYAVDHTWRTLKAWLIHFSSETYRLETGQEVLVKGRELPG